MIIYIHTMVMMMMMMMMMMNHWNYKSLSATLTPPRNPLNRNVTLRQFWHWTDKALISSPYTNPRFF